MKETGTTPGVKTSFSVATETIIHSSQFAVEHKQIDCTLNRNHLGDFIRITEETRGRRNSVIIPLEGMEKLEQALRELRTFPGHLDHRPP